MPNLLLLMQLELWTVPYTGYNLIYTIKTRTGPHIPYSIREIWTAIKYWFISSVNSHVLELHWGIT
jgi:hypothetical protein